MGGSGRIWEDFDGFRLICEDLLRFGRIWEDFGGFGRLWEDLAAGEPLEGPPPLEGSWRAPGVPLEGPWKAPEGPLEGP